MPNSTMCVPSRPIDFCALSLCQYISGLLLAPLGGFLGGGKAHVARSALQYTCTGDHRKKSVPKDEKHGRTPSPHETERNEDETIRKGGVLVEFGEPHAAYMPRVKGTHCDRNRCFTYAMFVAHISNVQ